MHATSRCFRTPIDTSNNDPGLFQAAARWLLAKPQNAVLGLAVLLILPGAPITGGTALVLLTLAQGARMALLMAGAAALVVALVFLVLGIPAGWTLTSIVGGWFPAVALAALLLALRSLTLVIQVSVIVVVVALMGFAIVVTDPAAFWAPYVAAMVEVSNVFGLPSDSEHMTPEAVTWSVAMVFWLLCSIALCLGNALYASLPIETINFGRFRDLNFGHVIAGITLVLSILGPLTEWSWAVMTANFLFGVFAIQGLAILHWLKAAGYVPTVLVVMAYAMFPLLVVLLAITGFVDAWIGFRRRWDKSKGSRT